MALVQKWPFFQLFFLGKIGQENVFYDILEEKKAFYAIKTRSWKSRKIAFFRKGLTHGFGEEPSIFPIFFLLSNIGQEMFFTIFKNEQTPFFSIKTSSSKSLKIDIFSNGLTLGFGPKMAIFGTFFFRQHRAGKCLLRYSRTKKRHCGL